MSLLTIVQDFCRINGLNIPATVTGSQDTTVMQAWGILNDLAENLPDESSFQAYTNQSTWTMIAAEDQGSIYTIAGPDWMYFHNDTFFDRTLMRPLYGPLTDGEWQQILCFPNPGPYYKFRIRGNHLLINPVPSTPFSLIAFEYASSYGVESAAGVRKLQFTDDTDTYVLPERVIRKGLIYKWKMQKGLPYAADETEYFKLLDNLVAQNNPSRTFNMACSNLETLQPGIFVPTGNWNV